MSLNIRIELEDQLTGRLVGLADAAQDLTTPMTKIAGELLRSTRQRFEGETGPDGVSWLPRKLRDGEPANPKKLLQDSGALLQSLTSDHGQDFVAIGVQKTGGAGIYAAIHQFGGTTHIKPKNKKALRTPYGIFSSVTVTIPARPFLGIDGRDQTRAVEILTDYLARAAGGGATAGEGAPA